MHQAPTGRSPHYFAKADHRALQIRFVDDYYDSTSQEPGTSS